MISKIYDWIEYKRRLAITIANLNYRIYKRGEYVPVDEIIPKGNIHEFTIDEKIVNESMKRISEGWDYYANAIYYANLSKSRVKLIFTRKSKLERVLDVAKSHFSKNV